MVRVSYMVIRARTEAENRRANLRDYEAERRNFTWDRVEAELGRPRGGRINIAHAAVDRWAADDEAADRPALIFESASRVETYTYADLKDESCRWANLLAARDYGPGDRVFILLRPRPEAYLAMLACARLGVLFCPLSAALSYDDLEVRFNAAMPRGVITDSGLAETLPPDAAAGVEHVFLVDEPASDCDPRFICATSELPRLSRRRRTRWLKPDTPLYLLFTSGSTGPPKGIVHAHRDAAGMLASARYALDLRPSSVLWTDAEPSWVTGCVYSAFAPWLIGAASVVQGDGFMASRWYWTLERHRVTNLYTTPNTIRGLIAAGEDLPTRYDLSGLEHVACVGETLPPEHYYWVRKNLGRVPHDTWWMTETGMICLAHFKSLDTKPGSIGKPLPGIEAAVIDDKGEKLPEMALGQLALKPGWPSMMVSTWRDRGRYDEYFRLQGWFLTGDVALVDEEGYFYHQGRLDDLIKVDKTFVGPYEIERTLIQHPAVAEAAVIALGAASREPSIKAFVVPAAGYTPSPRLAAEIKAFVRTNLSADLPLAQVAFLEAMPKTGSGKILRRALRASELGLPLGNVSNLKD